MISKKKLGQFFTEQVIADLMVKWVTENSPSKILDLSKLIYSENYHLSFLFLASIFFHFMLIYLNNIISRKRESAAK